MALLVRDDQAATGGLTVSNNQSVESNVAAGVDALVLTENASTISLGVNVIQGAVTALTLTEYGASIDIGIPANVANLTLTTYTASIAQTAALDDTTLNPGQTTNVQLTGFATLPDSATINGVAATISNVTLTTLDLTAPAYSTFAAGQSHVNTQWDTVLQVVISNGSGETATTNCQIVSPETAGPNYWFGQAGTTPFPSDSLFPALSTGDDYFVDEISGDIFFVTNQGVVIANSLPSTVEVRGFTAGAWTTIESYELVAGIPTQVANLTLTEYPASVVLFAGQVNAFVQNLTLTEYTAAIGFEKNVFANTASLTLTEQPAALSGATEVFANTGTLVITEPAATITLNVEVFAGTDTLALTSYVVELPTDIETNVDALVVTGNAASISTGADTAVNAGVTNLVLSESRANIDVDITVGVDALVISTYTAAVAATPPNNIAVNTNLERLVIVGAAAAVTGANNDYVWTVQGGDITKWTEVA